jgi:DNA-directed RNA polymerase specialized sigma subunit
MVTVQDKALKSKYIKRIEKHLRQYTTYKIGMMTLQKQLDHIMPNVTATYKLSEGSNGTFEITSDTEDYAVDRIESKKALMLHEDIERYGIIIESIDQAVSDLDEMERKFVEVRYINRKTIAQTSIELGYSEKHIFNLRHQVMDKLLISLRGLTQE